MPNPPQFRRLLHELIDEYGGTKQDLATAIGITPSSLSHLISTEGIYPSVEVCFRLAKATGASASKILRAAGKDDIAELVEDLYGEAAQRRLKGHTVKATPREERHLQHLRTINKRFTRMIFALTEEVAAKRGPADGKLLFPPVAQRR